MRELKTLLINISDSYYDFVESMMDEARKSEDRKNALLDFLRNNPKTTTSDVISYVVDELGLYDEYTNNASSLKMSV
ncbi:MAG: hypothetical protein K6G57_04515 [Lachnospiraceae bacterium]|nr:hypothetical protein [Lachnospiraceae bacterium]